MCKIFPDMRIFRLKSCKSCQWRLQSSVVKLTISQPLTLSHIIFLYIQTPLQQTTFEQCCKWREISRFAAMFSIIFNNYTFIYIIFPYVCIDVLMSSATDELQVGKRGVKRMLWNILAAHFTVHSFLRVSNIKTLYLKVVISLSHCDNQSCVWCWPL